MTSRARVNIAITIFLLGGILTSAASRPKNVPDSTRILELRGTITEVQGKAGLVNVYLIESGRTVDSVFLRKGKNRFTFMLEKDKYYTVRISSEGHYTKLVCIDTKNSRTPKEEEYHTFSFETELLSDDQGQFFGELCNFPAAIIYFDQKAGKFCYNRQYTRVLQQELNLTRKSK